MKRFQGFGYDSNAESYHFSVVVANDGSASVIEHRPLPDIRIVISSCIWSEIAGYIQEEFNRRLKAHRLPIGRWGKTTLLDRLFGKELLVLAWSVESIEPDLISVVIQNWRGLAPEERWWLCSQADATRGHPLWGPERGWRKAIQIALTENPVG